MTVRFLGPWATAESEKYLASHVYHHPKLLSLTPQFCLNKVIALPKTFSWPVKSNKTLRLEVGALTHKLLNFPFWSSSLSMVFMPFLFHRRTTPPYLISISSHGKDGMIQSSNLARLRLPWNFCQNHKGKGRYPFGPDSDKLLDHESWGIKPNM